MKLSNYIRVVSVALLTTLISTSAGAQKLYKWVDAQGNISYQDQPPPESGKLLEEKTVAQGKSNAATATGNQPTIKVYTVDSCAPCAQVVLNLMKMGVPHVELPLNDDREAQSLILEKTSSLIAPTILIGDQVLQAPSEADLKQSVIDAGYEVTE
ncbi:hypothetical protein GCM10008090_19420 [Arenicella chitinivorans]|uniref:Glutaredoxin n=1 Tax=Arenicella chitinivorans TaxID=1329800 RepID=A0A918VM88_9GAMM|nr:glutaredoxin family protein [Arenicella chitinivorans]GHA09972.1 hypothetical protein GCM10008090_19420 [Arenicella chitinivorans]